MGARLFILAVLALSVFFGAGRARGGDDRKPTEYQVKAAYIYNFAKFVEWPAGGNGSGNGVIEVCMLGDDPFGPDLAMIEGKKVRDRTIRIRQLASYRDCGGCDILFICNSEQEQLPRILKELHRSPVLTIGDTGGYAEKGVMVNLFMENKMVRFEINPKAALRAGLRISSNLLRLAKIVGEP